MKSQVGYPTQKVMAGVAQLVRASVCGTECRQFESGHPPHKIQAREKRALILCERVR